MACEDKKHREFMNVPVDSEYELSVTGPAGFAAFAQFDNEATNKLETWPSAQITPGPKKKRLPGAGLVHVVFVFVTIDPTRAIDVEIEATLDGKKYCRTVRGKGTQEIIIHTIRMA